MGKKENKNLKIALSLNSEFGGHVDVQLIEQLLKDSDGNADRVRIVLTELSTTVCHKDEYESELPMKIGDVSNDSLFDLSECHYASYRIIYDIFFGLFADLLDEESLTSVWSSILETFHPLSDADQCLVLQTAIDTAFLRVQEAIANDAELKFDFRSTQHVALSLLIDRFDAKHNATLTAKIKSILIESNYDIEAATERICILFESKLNDELEYPSLEQSLLISSKKLQDSKRHVTKYSEFFYTTVYAIYRFCYRLQTFSLSVRLGAFSCHGMSESRQNYRL